MKKIVFVMLACVEFAVAQSQPAAVALEGKSKTLQERYYLMKIKSETYQNFKVINEGIMDAVWKIANDSLHLREQQLKQANAKITLLQNEVNVARASLKLKEESMASVEFASTHINVLGKSFSKGVFLALVSVGGAALLATILFLLARMKAMQVFVKESKTIVTSITSEFDDYKRKTFEKQTKLTRELQTERNKLMELKESQRMV